MAIDGDTDKGSAMSERSITTDGSQSFGHMDILLFDGLTDTLPLYIYIIIFLFCYRISDI